MKIEIDTDYITMAEASGVVDILSSKYPGVRGDKSFLCLFNNKHSYIAAIKDYRLYTGCGLKQAKEEMDRARACVKDYAIANPEYMKNDEERSS